MNFKRADVVIIGGGIVGTAIARELSKYELVLVLVERESDIGCGATKANSGIVHAGYDAIPGSLKARLNVRGNALYESICQELDVPFRRIGSLVLAFSGSEVRVLEELYQKGVANGVPDLRLLDRETVLKREPLISDKVVAALYAPTAGIVSPYGLAIAYGENANDNGVEILLDTEVVNITTKDGGVEFVVTNRGAIEAKWVINCAGLYVDEIMKMVGINSFYITPRKGEYCILDKEVSYQVSQAIFPTPTILGKGILVAPTAEGNLLIGPNAHNIEDKEDLAVTEEGIEEIIKGAQRLVPSISKSDVIAVFAGLRARGNTGDFLIEPSKVRGFINVAGMESPGLSATPAIGEMIVEILRDEGLPLKPKRNWNPLRRGILRFSELSLEEKDKAIERDPLYGHIICRCETVTEGEIIEAIKRPLGARDLDAIKRRTRAGSGRCQGGFCTPRVAAILARELNLPLTRITKKGFNSYLLLGRIKERWREGAKEDEEKGCRCSRNWGWTSGVSGSIEG